MQTRGTSGADTGLLRPGWLCGKGAQQVLAPHLNIIRGLLARILVNCVSQLSAVDCFNKSKQAYWQPNTLLCSAHHQNARFLVPLQSRCTQPCVTLRSPTRKQVNLPTSFDFYELKKQAADDNFFGQLLCITKSSSPKLSDNFQGVSCEAEHVFVAHTNPCSNPNSMMICQCSRMFCFCSLILL